MKSIKVLLVFLLLSCASVTAQDTFCLRNKIKITKGWSGAYTALQLEHRTQDCWFVRPIVGYRFTPWLKWDVAYEFRQKYSYDLKQKGTRIADGEVQHPRLNLQPLSER